jgi:hypothetical protein
VSLTIARARRALALLATVLQAACSASFTEIYPMHLAPASPSSTWTPPASGTRARWMRLILLLERTFNGVSALKATCAEASTTQPQQAFRRELLALVAEIAAAFAGIERAILARVPCTDRTPALDEAYAPLEARYGELRRTDGLRDYAVTDLARFDSSVLALNEVSHSLKALSAVVSSITSGRSMPATSYARRWPVRCATVPPRFAL